ncbi:MAG: right-handed parallel beta-helix repeat-containing protein [bacterium]
MRHILRILLILASIQMSFGQVPEAQSLGNRVASSAGQAEKAAQDYIAQLFQRIQELKAANQYDETLWREYIGLTEEEAPSISHLDQGGSTCATATVIPWLPCGDMGTLDPDGNDDCAGRPFQDVFYRYTAVENGFHLFHMCDAVSAGDTYIRIWPYGCCTSSAVIADDNCYGGGLDGMVWVYLIVGQTVYIECGYYYTTGGTTYALWGLGPGFDCWNPIPVSLPADVPYSNTNTTCGKINYYTETCLGNYDEGQDILYQLNVTSSAVIVDIALTSNASWVGICVDNSCPPDLSCVNSCGSSGNSCSMTNVFLPTGTYYLMIDTWPLPDCIPEFTLTINPACELSGALSGTLGPGLCRVVGDIWVNSGDLLTLQPGTTFRFDGPYSFKIYGTLSAIGTASNSIVFTTEQTGSNRWRGLRFEGSTSSGSRLAYCLIEKGYATGDFPNNCGGGVYCYQSSPIFTHCTLSSNFASYGGGGVFCYYSSPSFTNCAVSGNSSAQYGGGGVLCYDYSSPLFSNCTVSGNSAAYNGGGVCCYYYSSPSLTNCTLSGNSASDCGGGVFCYYSSPSLTNCAVSGNSASYAGGGVYCNYSSLSLTNCTVSTNSATHYGGGMCCFYSSPSLTNCTVSGNSATYYSGGMYCYYSSPTIKSTVIAFSTGSGIHFESSAGSQVGYCDLFGNSGGNFQFINNDPSHGPPGIGQLTTTNANGDPCDVYRNIFLDPLFVNRPAGDFHLTDLSHCIGAGNPTSPPPTDFEGDPRPNPAGTNPDIGIDEHWLGCPVGRLAITMASGNAVLYWPYFAYTVKIYGATAPYTTGTLLATVNGVTSWTDLSTPSRPSPYFYYVKAVQ